MDTGPLWLALAATSGAIGAGWQTVTAVLFEIKSMDAFLGAHNEIIREERARIRSSIPSWRLRKRRRALKAATKEALDVLSPSELELSRRYDLQSYGWSFVVIAALIACVVAWVDVANNISVQ